MSVTARDEILGRLRAALAAAPAVVDPVPDAPATRPRAAGPVDAAALFAERVADYRATVTWCDGAARVGATVDAALTRHGARRVVVADGVPVDWRPRDGSVTDAALSPRALDVVDGVVTGCALAIAETGTVILDGGPLSGRRLITLVPDLHVCVVQATQVVGTTAEAFRRIGPALVAGHPLTLVSGPSATSDIELSRVEGVHGPRRLEVVVVDG
ncbi:MAG TPA: LUD domain-containing protein [Baekduia sp.]|uniref:LutC/YkgG family protein n=1 Tax=Baekduia sp. TaxID=2600305 RepID=UPI002D78BF20|nr:LUD domain-containing protein [Baekduia sp.]HET6507873.1 LUD domain-containing protein [Baekduia sp.]